MATMKIKLKGSVPPVPTDIATAKTRTGAQLDIFQHGSHGFVEVSLTQGKIELLGAANPRIEVEGRKVLLKFD